MDDQKVSQATTSIVPGTSRGHKQASTVSPFLEGVRESFARTFCLYGVIFYLRQKELNFLLRGKTRCCVCGLVIGWGRKFNATKEGRGVRCVISFAVRWLQERTDPSDSGNGGASLG